MLDRGLIITLDSLLYIYIYIYRERERDDRAIGRATKTSLVLIDVTICMAKKDKKGSPTIRRILIPLNFMCVVHCYPSVFEF